MTTYETILLILGSVVAISVAIGAFAFAVYMSLLSLVDLRREVIRVKILALMGIEKDGGYHEVGPAVNEWVESDLHCNEEKEAWRTGYMDHDDMMRTVRRVVERVLEQIVTGAYPKKKNKPPREA